MAGGLRRVVNVILDAGYRYINFGNVKSGTDTFGAMTFKNPRRA